MSPPRLIYANRLSGRERREVPGVRALLAIIWDRERCSCSFHTSGLNSPCTRKADALPPRNRRNARPVLPALRDAVAGTGRGSAPKASICLIFHTKAGDIPVGLPLNESTSAATQTKLRRGERVINPIWNLRCDTPVWLCFCGSQSKARIPSSVLEPMKTRCAALAASEGEAAAIRVAAEEVTRKSRRLSFFIARAIVADCAARAPVAAWRRGVDRPCAAFGRTPHARCKPLLPLQSEYDVHRCFTATGSPLSRYGSTIALPRQETDCNIGGLLSTRRSSMVPLLKWWRPVPLFPGCPPSSQ